MNPASAPNSRQTIRSGALICAAALLASAWFLWAEHRIAGLAGYPLDDSWIYATFARNLATGQGYAFNPGHPVSGATGPLYVFVLTALYAVFGDVVWPAKILGILCLIGSAWIVAGCVRRVAPQSPPLSLLAGLLTALSPPLIWGSLSGLEIPLEILVVAGGLLLYLRERWALAALCWSVAVWLRPDGLFLAALGLACPAPSRKRVALATALPILGYFAFNLTLGGSLFPTSVAAKAAIGGDVLSRAWTTVSQWLWLWGLSIHAGRFGPHAVFFVPAMMVGAVLARKRRPVLAFYPLAFPVVFGAFGPSGGQHGRYLVSTIPFGIVLSCIALAFGLVRVSATTRTGVWVALVAVLVGWQVTMVRLVGTTYGWNVQNINAMHRFMAEEVVRRLPAGQPVAVNDVGAAGYFGGHEIVDLAGLMTPHRSLPENLAAYHPPYLIVFPNWFRQYVVTDPTTGQPIFRDPTSKSMYAPVFGVKLEHNTIASRKMMVVYKRFPIDSPAVANPELVVH